MSSNDPEAALSLDALIEALEAPRPDPGDDLAVIVEWMTERRDLVASLEAHARRPLSEADRARLRACLERVLGRDVAIIRDLLARREKMAAELQQLPSARAGVRGYASANRDEPAIPIRSV